MDLDLTGFNIRKTQPFNAGILGLPEDVERYVAKAQGLIGFEVFAGDIISIINTEGVQIAEVVAFDNSGKCSQDIISCKKNSDASFIKNILENSPDNKFLLTKLKKKNIDFHKAVSTNFFNAETKVRLSLIHI